MSGRNTRVGNKRAYVIRCVKGSICVKLQDTSNAKARTDEKGKLENNVSVALEIPSESASKGSSVVLISD